MINIPENFKKTIPAIVFVILAIVGIALYNKNQDEKKDFISEIITEKEPNLTAEQKQAAEDRLAIIKEKIEKPPENATNIEKYSWNMQAGFQKLTLGKFLEAKEAFLVASQIQPNDYTAQVALYQAYLSMNDYAAARESIKKAVSLDYGNSDVWRKYIQLEQEKFNPSNEEMRKLFSQAFSNTGSDIDIITIFAQFLEEKGDLSGAIEQWKKAATAYPKNEALYQAEITRLEGLIK